MSIARDIPAWSIRNGSRSRSRLASADGSGRSVVFPAIRLSKYCSILRPATFCRSPADTVVSVRSAPVSPISVLSVSSWREVVPFHGLPLQLRGTDVGGVGLAEQEGVLGQHPGEAG